MRRNEFGLPAINQHWYQPQPLSKLSSFMTSVEARSSYVACVKSRSLFGVTHIFSKTLKPRVALWTPHAPKEVTGPPQGIQKTPSSRPPRLPTNFSFTGHESKRREENLQLQISLNKDKAQRKHSTCSLRLLPSCRRRATAFFTNSHRLWPHQVHGQTNALFGPVLVDTWRTPSTHTSKYLPTN